MLELISFMTQNNLNIMQNFRNIYEFFRYFMTLLDLNYMGSHIYTVKTKVLYLWRGCEGHYKNV